MSRHGNESFFATCESIIKSICLACEHNLSQDNQFDIISQRLNIFKGELIEAVTQRKIDTSDIMSMIKTMNEHNILNINSKLDHIPRISGKIDELKDRIDVTKVVETSVSRNNDSLVHTLNTIKHSQDQMSNKLETIVTARNTTRYKGEEGEQGLIQILETKLRVREGYTITEVKSIPHSCDILVKRDGYPDIRIESKAHNDNVRVAEVKKFESDLLTLNNHGIFVSLYSGICGKNALEIELLPNNKFAIYLSNNNYDGDIITEIIRLIYTLDRFTTGPESENITISTDAMMRIKAYLTDFNRKIDELRTSLKNSIRILNEITLDLIEKTLTGHIIIEEPQTSVNFTCDTCSQTCTSKAGLTLHKKKCPPRG
jgi:Fe-S cluster assembly iron-binding protein IscA